MADNVFHCFDLSNDTFLSFFISKYCLSQSADVWKQCHLFFQNNFLCDLCALQKEVLADNIANKRTTVLHD